MAIHIRRASEQDANAVYEVHSRAIREVCSSHYSQRDIEAWAGRLFPGAHREAICARAFFVAAEADEVLGFGQLMETAEVEAVYVHPAALRRRIGSRLLAELERQARAAGIASIHLDASLNSVAFYAHAGFRHEGPARHSLGESRDIACVRMRRELR